jgi:hypothetical protein
VKVDVEISTNSTLIPITTLKKGSLATKNHYDDHIHDPVHMQWRSQTQPRRDSQIGRMIEGTEPGARVHRFVRNGKLRNCKATFPLLRMPSLRNLDKGEPDHRDWELQEPVPARLRAVLGTR